MRSITFLQEVTKAFSASAIKLRGADKILIYDVLVFGAVSSPTLWGRYASFLGRSSAATNPHVRVQVYLDDPILTFNSSDPLFKRRLGVLLLWAGVTGFPIKLEKSDCGLEVKWVGAQLRIDKISKTVIVSIPADYMRRSQQFCQDPWLIENNFNPWLALSPS